MATLEELRTKVNFYKVDWYERGDIVTPLSAYLTAENYSTENTFENGVGYCKGTQAIEGKDVFVLFITDHPLALFETKDELEQFYNDRIKDYRFWV